MIDVLVAAPYPLARAGLRAMIEAAPDCALVGETATLAEAGDAVDRLGPNVLVADLGSAAPATFAELAELAAEQPDLGLVVLADPGAERRLPPLARGRLGYLGREAPPTAIVQAVRAVAAGLVVLEPDALPGLVAAAPRLTADPLLEPLTPREIEVLGWMAQGLPNKTIARHLAISEHTVKFHVGAILAKLGAASRTEAVTLAARQGLLML